MTDNTYDVIVIGGGAVGEVLAERVVKRGLSAAIVESELLGGECSYWACMPSKALLRSGEALRAAKNVKGASSAVTGELDVPAVFERRDSFTKNWDDSSQREWADGAGITVLKGRARLDGPKRVVVRLNDGGDGAGDNGGEERTLEARHAVAACVGSLPRIPDIPGLREIRPWTSRDATSAREAPRRLAVIGAGPVGSELAQAWNDLGSEVTLLVSGDRMLPSLEPFAGEYVAKAHTEAGIDIRTNITVQSVTRLAGTGGGEGDEGPLSIKTDQGEIVVDQILAATGRAPSTGELGLESIGLEPGTWLDVDDSCRVSGVEGGWLYSAGDTNHRALFTHQGKYQARIAGDAIAARAKGEHAAPVAWSPYAATADHGAVPAVVFTDPEVATVGLTEQAAIDQGITVRVAEYDIGNVAGASLYVDGYSGHAKLVVDQERLVPVGFTAVGPGAGDLLHAATIAIVGEVPLDRLWHAVPAYPTVSEVWLRLLETYGM
ncbi:dihydrolipoamide dehydrogenase [Actinopolymorpha cephalotaxi]|uniref:Dihydrolipoamide dehydrogenase n=1 Tax=Actinopolymorpha cephalotaxi TaxID=504797 RepID=A0A1I3AT61_9ACTN|nr:NAD(P)/FAD-dependent oxidoreductase [Actinopolymorpha cephalotaxi]NYH86058.1 dihydrolipoamide dehydrogenase [Actinopolymorpha cephalotaxi]SFH53277.1 dihydrolipoamide dehydrogenase [Actinopolymorpha cephalotaxi]